MKKFSAIVMTVIISVVFMCNSVYISGESAISVSAKAAVLIEAETGRIIYEKNSNQILQMASTTKIMTTLLAIESGNLDEYFTVDSNAIKVEGSSMGLVEGDQVTMRALCYGMMLPSGNDAANSVAVKIAGSSEAFAVLMNERAKKIGMTNTNFVTPSGLDDYTDNHYSTAYDMALLTREALKNPIFREICSTISVKLEYGNPPYGRWLTNSNKLLTSYHGTIGVKTGFTDKARRCLVSACERDGVTLIAVTLNSPSDWQDHKSMFDYGYSKVTKTEIPFSENELSLNIVGGESETIKLRPEKTPVFLIPPEEIQNLTKRIYLPAFEYAPLNSGQVLGYVEFLYKGEVVSTIPLVTENAVFEKQVKPKKTLWQKIKNLF